MNTAELTCDLGHVWYGTCRYDARGYPLIAGAEPLCPTCQREARSAEACLAPVHPEVRERAAA